MKESLQSRIGKAQVRLADRRSLLAGNFLTLKNNLRNNMASPKALIVACVVGFLLGRHRVAAGLHRPVKSSIGPLVRASVRSGYAVIWRRLVDAAFNVYRSSKESVGNRQILADKDQSIT